jgi:hypothetical protein
MPVLWVISPMFLPLTERMIHVLVDRMSRTGRIVNTLKPLLPTAMLTFFLVFGAIAVVTIAVPHLEAAQKSSMAGMNARVATFEADCTSLGGTTEVIEETTTANGPFVTTTSITVECTGGGWGSGQRCVLTPKTTDCGNQPIAPRPTAPGIDDPMVVVPATVHQPQSPGAWAGRS